MWCRGEVGALEPDFGLLTGVLLTTVSIGGVWLVASGNGCSSLLGLVGVVEELKVAPESGGRQYCALLAICVGSKCYLVNVVFHQTHFVRKVVSLHVT